jgi:copper chaperone CopZ
VQKLKFKTNINCSGCVARATPVLNGIPEITKWQVDTSNKDKILEAVTHEKVDSNIIISKLNEVGFKAEIIDI